MAGGSLVTKPTYDRSFWEELWSKTLREHADKVAQRPPNAHLVGEVVNCGGDRGMLLEALTTVRCARQYAVGLVVSRSSTIRYDGPSRSMPTW